VWRRGPAVLRGLALLLLHLLHVELELLALEDVAIAAAALSGAGGNAGVEAALVELVGDVLVNLAALVAGLHLPLDVLGLRTAEGGGERW
jgi:hypothetical protein